MRKLSDEEMKRFADQIIIGAAMLGELTPSNRRRLFELIEKRKKKQSLTDEVKVDTKEMNGES